MNKYDRRDFLRMLAATSGGMGAFPSSIQNALAIPAHRETGTLQDVKHIVILVQENRSFDHYFGSLRGVRGFGDKMPAILPNGKPVWYQPDGHGGYVLPFRPDLPEVGMHYLDGTPHDWTTSQKAWNQGRYDQWVPNKGVNTMSYLTREDIPYFYALAEAFTICDAYHCSVMGPTDPNRYHMWTGGIGNLGTGGGPVIDNAEKGYSWTTFPERLEQAGIEWKIYQDVGFGLDAAGRWGDAQTNAFIGNYGDNSLLYFEQYRTAEQGSPLYERARTGTNLAKNPQQSLFEHLQKDVATGKLPAVSWIVAPEAYSEHANWPANFGAWYTSKVIETLVSNPEVWSKTVLFVTYDENDGFFDHVVPPYPPASREFGLSTVDVSDEIFPGDPVNQSGPYGLGARVPMTIVSPWTKGGWVCSQVFDHTSLIRFIERRFGSSHPRLTESNISAWRRAVCGDLTSAFDFGNPDPAFPRLPATSNYLPSDQRRRAAIRPLPPMVQQVPVQEVGVRPARPLPYTFDVRGGFSKDRNHFTINFENRGPAGAWFLVNAVGTTLAPRSYTVEAGKRLTDLWPRTTWESGHYDLMVTGPNGFLRRYSGQSTQPMENEGGSANLEVQCEATTKSSRLRLILRNDGARPASFKIVPDAYMHMPAQELVVPAGSQIPLLWSLAETQGWYAISVTTAAESRYLRRFSGHVENGKSSTSDPATA
jgi:phospholipase C